MTPPPASRKHVRLIVCLTLLLTAGFAALAAPVYLFTGDTEAYVELARMIASGKPYAFGGRPEVTFPPGFPLILAPAAWSFPESFTAVSRWAAALASMVFPLTWLYVRRENPRLALPVTVLTVSAVPFLTLATDNPMSEPVYLALSMGLLLWVRTGEEMTPPLRGWRWGLLGCVLLVALPAVRTAGIAAVAAYGLWMILKSRPRPAANWAPLAAGIAFLLAWFIWVGTQAVPRDPSQPPSGYIWQLLLRDPHHPDLGRASISDLLERLANNLVVQGAHVGELLTPVTYVQAAWHSPVLLVLPCIFLGWWKGLRGTGSFAALYFLFYLAIILTWPFDEGTRFLLPVLPLLWVYVFEGFDRLLHAIREDHQWLRVFGILWSILALTVLAESSRMDVDRLSRQDIGALIFAVLIGGALLLVWRRLVGIARSLGPRQTRPLAAAGVVLLALGSLAQALPPVVQRSAGTLPSSGNSRSLWEASQWLIANTAPDAVVQTTYHTRVYFATGRASVPLPVTISPRPFLEVDQRYNPQFLIILDSDDPYNLPLETDRFEQMKSLFPGKWHWVHRFNGGNIYASR